MGRRSTNKIYRKEVLLSIIWKTTDQSDSEMYSDPRWMRSIPRPIIDHYLNASSFIVERFHVKTSSRWEWTVPLKQKKKKKTHGPLHCYSLGRMLIGYCECLETSEGLRPEFFRPPHQHWLMSKACCLINRLLSAWYNNNNNNNNRIFIQDNPSV